MMSRKPLQTFDVYVSNLPLEANERNVGKLFTKFGEIKSIYIKESSKDTGQKYAYVKYLCEPDAERAVAEQNGVAVDNRKIFVRRSEPRKKGATPDKDGKKGFRGQPDIVPTEECGIPPMMQSYTQKEPTEELSVMVTHVENPVCIWGQVVNDDNTQKLFDMTEQLRTLCPAAPKVTAKPEYNKVYAAKYLEDLMWYRCCVKQFFGTDKMKVQYIDYGNTEEIDLNVLVEIPQNLAAIPSLSQKIVLHNTKAKDISNQNGIHFLKGLIEGKIVMMQKTCALADASGFYAKVTIDGNSLNELVVQQGYATQRPAMNSRQGGTSGVESGQNLASRSISGDANTGKMNITVSRGIQGSARDSSRDDTQNLRTELNKKKRDLEKIRTEKDVVTMELNAMKGKMKNMQDDYSTMSHKVLENTLSNRMRTLIDLSDKVRKLRCQFPSGKTSVLEVAIALAKSPEKVQNSSVTTLQPVISTLKTYEAAQKEVTSCSDMNELKEIITARDQARFELFEKLKLCVEELNEMPVEERRTKVRDTEQELKEYYGGLLNFVVHSHPSLDDLLPGFKDWKNKKNSEFCEVRKMTNHYQQAVDNSLKHFQQLLQLDDPTVTKSDIELDNLMNLYAQALQKEISVTDTEHTRDSSLIATVMAAVSKELNNELKSLENLTQLKSEFKQLKTDIEPWLQVRPNLSELQDVRKQIRLLKSKLRHKMADIQDLEENDGSDGELGCVKREVNNIKHDLHKSLSTMEKLLGDLSVIADRHFPELIKQHADFGIDIQMAHSGLVKVWREIEHYTLTPALRLGAYESTFAGDSVLIQEFHVGDSDHITKDEFLQQVTSYNKTARNCSNLLTVDTIFFNKTERQAFIQMPWPEGQTVEEFYKSSTLSEKSAQSFIRDVMEAVAALHAVDIIHGEINPSNIVILKDKSTMLLSPDFSKQAVDRSKKRFVTDSEMVFQSPEVSAAVTPFTLTKSSDLYNIGLLILWIQYPDSVFSAKFDGTPDISNVSMDSDLLVLMSNMLLGNPGARSPIGSCLASSYLRKTIEEPEPCPTDISQMEGNPQDEFDGNSMNTGEYATTENLADSMVVISAMELPTDSDDYGIQHSIPDLPSSSDTDLLSTGGSSPLAEELSEKSSKDDQAEVIKDSELEEEMPELSNCVMGDYSSPTLGIEDIMGRRDSSEIDRELLEIHALTNSVEHGELSTSDNCAEASPVSSSILETEKGDADRSTDPEALKMQSEYPSYISDSRLNTRSPLHRILNLTENANKS
ncbi:hypothetical protein ScPMuIL_004787 [Solemya velum]